MNMVSPTRHPCVKPWEGSRADDGVLATLDFRFRGNDRVLLRRRDGAAGNGGRGHLARHHGVGDCSQPCSGPIPFGPINRYTERFGIAESGFDLMLAMLDRLDSEFLAWEGERARARAAARG